MKERKATTHLNSAVTLLVFGTALFAAEIFAQEAALKAVAAEETVVVTESSKTEKAIAATVDLRAELSEVATVADAIPGKEVAHEEYLSRFEALELLLGELQAKQQEGATPDQIREVLTRATTELAQLVALLPDVDAPVSEELRKAAAQLYEMDPGN